MAVPPSVWPLLGLLWLLAAPSVQCRGDAFQTEEMPEKDLSETTSLLDDILDINQKLILLEEPENSFLIEGDIVRLSPFRMFPFADPRWPKKGGIVQVPYIISYKYDMFSVKRIQEAFLEFEKSTCIKFVPYSSQRDFISIAPLSGCYSSVGRTGGMQVVSLAPACLRKGSAIALHELMHVLGFGHEHSRVDRDKYISIAWDEILPGFKMNFMKFRTSNMLVDYDYSSVLHYSRTAFSLRGLPTMVPLARSCPHLGQRWNLSRSDIARVNRLYNCWEAAAQPATEQPVEGTVTRHVPSESETSMPTIQAGPLSTWSPIAPATQVAPPSIESHQQVDNSLPFSTGIKEDLGAKEGHSRGTAAPRTEDHDLEVVTQETSNKTEMDEKHLMVTEGTLYSTRPTELALESTASMSQALQNITSSATQSPHHEGDYTPSRPNVTEKMKQAAPEMALTTSSLPTSPEPLVTDVAKGTAGRPSKSILHQLLSGTSSTYGEQTEPPTSIAVGSNGTQDIGSLSLTKGHFSPVMETSTEEQKKAFHTSVSQAGGEVGEHVSMYSVGVGAETPSSPSITPSLKEFGKPTVGLGHDAQVQAGTKVPEGTKLGGKTSLWLVLSTESPGSQWKVVTTKETSPGAEAKEPGSILPSSETIPPPTWMSNSGNLGEENETGHYTESQASSTAWSEPSKLLKSTPESVATSYGRTPAMTHDSEPEKVGGFAGGRLTTPATTPASVTKEAAKKGLDWATTQAPLGQRGSASALLEVGSPTYITSQGVTHTSLGVTKGMTRPRKTGSLESPKFGFPSEGASASQPPGETLPQVSSPVGITTASQAYTPTAAPIDALENQTVAAIDGQSGMSTIFKESREPLLDTVRAKRPTETHMSASMATKLAGVGSSQPQTEMGHLQGTAWSIPEMREEAKITKFLLPKGTSPIPESGVQGPPDPNATDAHLGSKRSVAKSAEMPEAAGTGVGPFLSRYIKGLGEPTAASEKWVAASSVGPNGK